MPLFHTNALTAVSSRQCIITILSWVERYIGNYTPNGWVVLAVLLDRLPLWKKNHLKNQTAIQRIFAALPQYVFTGFFNDMGHNSFEQG